MISEDLKITLEEKFRNYYLPQAKVFGVTFGFLMIVTVLTSEDKNIIRGIFVWIGAVFCLTIFVGGIYHFWDDVLRSKRSNKLFKRKKIQKIKSLGFTTDPERNQFTGFQKDYYMTLQLDSSPTDGDKLIVNVFVAPTEDQLDSIDKVAKKYDLRTSDDFIWFSHEIGFVFGFSPKLNTIKKEIENMIKTLRYHKIEPLMFED